MTTTKNNEHKNIKVPNKREQNQTCLDSAEREGLRPKGNVPNLRFPEFQGEWISKTIGDIAPLQRGFDLPTGKICNGKIPVVYSNGIMNHHSSYKCVAPGLVTGRSGTIGKFTYIEDGYYWPHNTSLWVTDFHDNNPKFIYYLYQTIHIEQYSTGSGVPTLNRNNVHRHKTFIPKLKEQNKIAAFLSLLDERIATQSKIIEDLKKLESAIIENVFDDKHSERLQLDNVGSYIRGLTYSSNDVVEHGGTLVMRSNNIVNGSLLDYNNNVVFVNKQMSAEQQLQNGDIVICMANGSSSLVGKSSFYDGNCHSPITVGAFCGIYRSKEPIVKWLFQTNKYRRYIWNSLQGGNGAIANLNGEDILNMSFSIPNATIKDTCVKMLTSMDSALENNMLLCTLYTLQKQYLLRQMFI